MAKRSVNAPQKGRMSDLPLLFLAGFSLLRLGWTVFFFLTGVKLLAVLSACGCLLHGTLLLFRKRAAPVCLFLGQLEVCCFGVLATIFTGWDSGFFLCPLAMLAGILFLGGSQEKRFFALQMPGILSLLMLLALSPLLPTHFNGVDAAQDALYFPTFAANLLLAAGVSTISAMLFCKQLDLTKKRLEMINRRLEYMATHDALTGLQNRHSMNELLKLCRAQAERSGVPFAVAMGDVDDFKHFNDTYGHQCGDQVLTVLAETFRKATREGDFVCRWGGEEILILFSATRSAAAKTVLTRVQEKIRRLEGVENLPEGAVTMTFGLCEYEPGWAVEELIRKTDEKLYQGKNNGKNCIID